MSLLDPKWKYTHSTATDIRKTFAKVRRELAKNQRSGTHAPKLQLIPASSGSGIEPAAHASKQSVDGIDARKREARC